MRLDDTRRYELDSHLEPHNHEVPKPYHADLRRGITHPCFCVFDGDHVHEVEDELHGQEGEEEADKVSQDRRTRNIQWSSMLFDGM